MELDIIVLCHNKLGLTIRCIEALYEYTTIPFHLYVLDDASMDETPQYIDRLAKEKGNVTYLRSNERYGTWNNAVKTGIENTTNKFAAIIGNSCTVEPEWFVAPLHILQNDPDVAVVSPKYLFPWGAIENAGMYLDKKLGIHNFGVGQASHRFTHIRTVDLMGIGASIMRREAMLGNIDTTTYLGFSGLDDLDICLTLRSKGWKLVYCGLATVYHKHHGTRPQDHQAYLDYWENYRRFIGKWGDYIKENIELLDEERLLNG